MAIGERGAGRGLRLAFRTYVHSQLQVIWDGEIVHSVGVDDLRSPEYPGDGGPGYAQVHVRMDNQLLQLWWRGRKLVRGLRCAWYAPQPSWEWAVGARAGGRADDHWVANLSFVSSEYSVDAGAVSLGMALFRAGPPCFAQSAAILAAPPCPGSRSGSSSSR